jgi:alkaline phosphatase
MQTEIAVQQLGKGIEILFGGGRRHYLPKEERGARTDGRNLFNEAQEAGYHLAHDRDGLSALNAVPALALFTPGHMSYEIDRPETEPSLADMTGKALELLGRAEKPFFIMIEAGRIDHAGHSNDPEKLARVTSSFENLVRSMYGVALHGATTEELLGWFRAEIGTRFQIRGLPETVASDMPSALIRCEQREKEVIASSEQSTPSSPIPRRHMP